MSSKGAITITQEELVRMKMRADLIPTSMATFKQQDHSKVSSTIFTRRAKSGRISGKTT